MTPEQLDEIEKLAEAQEFLRAGSYALPLAKALREARSEADITKAFHDVAVKERDYERVRSNRIEKERDEALAEAKKWHLKYDCLKGDADVAVIEMNAAVEFADNAKAEVERLKAERDEARKLLEGICSEFEGAVAHADWRAAGSKGMSVPFTGDFASVVQLPGAINKMRWWIKVFRAVLNGEQP